MGNQLHTVLGASGASGMAVVQELQKRNLKVRAVQRSGKHTEIETINADLLKPQETLRAIEGSSHVYLCAAVPYNAKLWAKHWPLMMQNVIEACSKTEANLIFLDNVYMYGPAPLAVPFNETHPQQPVSKKGITRKQTASLLLDAFDRKKVKGVIGRSADFYGPNAVNSPFYVSFLQNMLKGKAPQSLVKPGIKHTYSYTVDNAKALVSLALSPETYGQVWHLPVGEPITIEELTERFNKELGTSFKTSFMPPVLQKALSVFIPIFKDLGEMLYQYDTEYNMSFDKFRKQFPNFVVTSYQQGIHEMVKSFRK